ncbi:MAG: sulfatase [Verrucomicrobiota bacterium JB024]|nr:sulfatase [Verrucomicrobiota bacterium JB024]
MATTTVSAPSSLPRNVIWIFGDQHRSQALSLHGDPNVHTPNIDRLGLEGQDFPRALMGYPLCCPCRGSLLSSRYPHQCVPGHEYAMPTETKTVAHAFAEHGYETAWFGKWHVDGFKEAEGRAAFHTVPPERRGGFETWIGYENNNSPWDSWVHGHRAGAGEVAHTRLPGFETDALTDLLLDFLEKRSQQGGEARPFFAGLSVQPPHNPYVAPAPFAGRHNPATLSLRPNVPAVPRVEQAARQDLAGYYGLIENLDWNVGRVMEALARLNLLDSTAIVFFSDHGDLHGSHGQFKKTAPWEESIRVPFMIWGGGSPYYGRQGASPALVNHVDLAPTSLGLCGLKPPEWMQGRDLSPLHFRGGPVIERPDSAYLQNVVPTGHSDSVDQPWRGVVTDDGWKLVCLERVPWLMFNLNEDPYEEVNLAHNSRYREVRERLLKRLRRWVEDTGDSFPLPE